MIQKFRAWGRDGNYPGTPSEIFEMFYDVSVVTTYDDKKQHVIADFGMLNESDYSGTKIIDYILMEYIGVLDKNGKEVYRYDIVKLNSGKLIAVMFLNGVFDTVCFYDSDQIEVVGNVLENPELLKEVEDENSGLLEREV